MDSSIEATYVSSDSECYDDEPKSPVIPILTETDDCNQTVKEKCTDYLKQPFDETPGQQDLLISSSPIHENDNLNDLPSVTLKDDASEEIPLNQMSNCIDTESAENIDISSRSNSMDLDPIDLSSDVVSRSISNCIVYKSDLLGYSLNKSSSSLTIEKVSTSSSIVSMATESVNQQLNKMSSNEDRKMNTFIKCLVKPEILNDAKLNSVPSVEMRLSQLSDKVLEVVNSMYSPNNHHKKGFKRINLKKISGENLYRAKPNKLKQRRRIARSVTDEKEQSDIKTSRSKIKNSYVPSTISLPNLAGKSENKIPEIGLTRAKSQEKLDFVDNQNSAHLSSTTSTVKKSPDVDENNNQISKTDLTSKRIREKSELTNNQRHSKLLSAANETNKLIDLDENNNQISRNDSTTLKNREKSGIAGNQNHVTASSSAIKAITQSSTFGKLLSPSNPKSTLQSFKIPKKRTATPIENFLPVIRKDHVPPSTTSTKNKIQKLNDKQTRVAPNQVRSVKLTVNSTTTNHRGSALITPTATVIDKHVKMPQAYFVSKIPTLKQLIEENNTYYHTMGCTNRTPQLSLNFLVKKYTEKASNSDLNFFNEHAYSHLYTLTKPEQSELFRLMLRNAGCVNVFKLYGIGSDLRRNQLKKEIIYEKYGKHEQSLRNEKPLEFSDSKDERDFMSKAFEEMTMAELFVVYSRFKQRINSPFRTVRLAYDRDRDLNMIRVRVENNWKPDSLDSSLEACVSYALHCNSIFKDSIPNTEKIAVKNKAGKIEILKNHTSDEEFNRLYLMKYVSRLKSRPTYRFNMKNFFDINGKFSLKTDDLNNYKLRKKDTNFKPPPISNMPRFENFTSTLYKEKDNNSFRGHMRKAERLTEMTQREYNYKMNQINKNLNDSDEINLTQLFDPNNSNV